MGWHAFQSFFIGGGIHPASVLAGYDHTTLSTALNVSISELRAFLTRQSSGLIVHISGSHNSNTWSKFMALEPHQRLAQLKRIVNFEEEASSKQKDHRAPSAYNLYNRNPHFQNDYGWTKKLDESDYSPLKQSGNGVYLVNLSPGSMMASYVNPTTKEYGVVLKGTGRIQIVYPNGTLAINARLHEGDVIWVPRYFPFCQIASTNGPFESLASLHQQGGTIHNSWGEGGRNSLMQSLRWPEFAAAFGIGEKRLKRITNAQHEQVILRSLSATPGHLV